MKKRANQILEFLSVENKLEVSTLAERLNVSQVTMRKDLDELEQQGIIRREHGFAILGQSDDINSRIAYHYQAKLKIAQRAAKLVQDGDTVMIESGSCCTLLAAELAKQKKDLTIVTNSAFIADYIRGTGVQISLLGGIYQPESRVLIGPMVRQCVENFWVKLFFIGADGYSVQTDFTNRDQLRAQAVRDMATQSDMVVVLTESEKLSHRGTVSLNLKDHRRMVITDAEISQNMMTALTTQGIEVITV